MGVNSAASCPNSAATRSWRARTVGSSPYTSSPTSAAAMAARIPSVSRVMVSLRRSIGTKSIRPRGRRCPSIRGVTSIESVSWPVTRPSACPSARPCRPTRRPSTRTDACPRCRGGLPGSRPTRPRWRSGSPTRTFAGGRWSWMADGRVVGDLYLAISDAWAQAEVQDRAGRCAGRDRLGAQPGSKVAASRSRRFSGWWPSISTTSASRGWAPACSPTTPLPGT